MTPLLAFALGMTAGILLGLLVALLDPSRTD